MSETISRKTVKARKPHYCDCCDTLAVQPGQTYDRQVNVEDGRIYTWITCNDCARISLEVWEWCGRPFEGIGPDEYHEWALEIAGHPNDPDWLSAVELLARRGFSTDARTETQP